MTALCVCGLAAEARIARRAGFAATIGAAAGADADCLVSFGIAGALDPGLRPGDLILSTEIVDDDGRRFDCAAIAPRIAALAAEIGALRAPVFGAREALATARDKRRVWEKTGAVAVDLESAVVARAAAARGIPFVALRAIADPATRDLPPAALVPLTAAGRPAIGAVLASLIRRPQQLPALLGVACEARTALRALAGPARALSQVAAGA